ncbi:helicase domain-containing protein [Coprinopsis cinerea AmutBmut pab1-1]|nr:helicase domain-containing protein [Coprinopsis cinerea AmutBmut pab1-1]
MTGFDKVLPHSLDAVTSDLLIQDLAIARPFAELAANICFPNNPDVLRLYDTHLFVNINSAFTTEHLSDTLRLYTLKYLGVSTGTRDWRHFTSGYRHKICPGYEEEKDREKEGIESLAALQAGHTRSTEMRLYGVSDSTVRGIAEDVMPNFLDKSTEWQVVVRVVPGGSLLPYRDARVEHFDALAAAGRIKSNYRGPQDDFATALEKKAAELEARLETRLEAMCGTLKTMMTDTLTSFFKAKTSGGFNPPARVETTPGGAAPPPLVEPDALLDGFNPRPPLETVAVPAAPVAPGPVKGGFNPAPRVETIRGSGRFNPAARVETTPGGAAPLPLVEPDALLHGFNPRPRWKPLPSLPLSLHLVL